MGVCGRTKNTVTETEQQTQLSQKNVTEIPNRERSDISNTSSVANQTEAIEAKPKPSSLPKEEVLKIPAKQTTNQPTYDKHNWPSGATGYVYTEDGGYTWIYTNTNKPQEIPEIRKSQISQTLVAPPDLSPPPEDALGNFDFRYKLYQDRAKAQYEIDIANAGDDKNLQSIAQQNYLLNQTKIASWRRSIESKFRLIQTDENLDSKERESLKVRVLDRAGDPIHPNSAAETQDMMTQLDDIEQQQRQQEWQQRQQKWQQQQEMERQQRELTNRLDDIERRQRWNNMERDNWQLKYNYLENKWQYAPSDSRLKYNALDNSWQYVPSP